MRWIALLLVLAGCPPAFDHTIEVRAYAAAPDHGSFVLFYSPWEGQAGPELGGARAVHVLSPIAPLAVECVNVACRYTDGQLTLPGALPPAVELVVTGAGYPPTRVTVPVEPGHVQTVMVLLKGAGS